VLAMMLFATIATSRKAEGVCAWVRVIKSCRPSESPPSKRVDQLPHTLGEPQNGSRGDLGVFKWD
jgi:hypothetical protein